MTGARAASGSAVPRMGGGGGARPKARAAAACALAALLLAWSCSMGPNIDSWFMLATGEWVAAHGIPEANPFAPSGADYPIVVQQWAYCVLLYLFHSAGGWPAVGLMNGMFAALMLCSLAFSLRSFHLTAGDRLRVAAPVMLAALFESAVRPHLLDMAVLLYLVGALERHRAAGDRRWALAAPAVVALHANLHLASVPIDVLVVAVRALPVATRGGGSWSFEWAPKAPCACAASCLAAACLTPYGPPGLAVPFWGSVGASYGGVLAECLPIWQLAYAYAWVVVAMLCTAMMVAWLLVQRPVRVDLAAAALMSCAFAATCLHARFFLFLSVSWVPALASSSPAAGGGSPSWDALCDHVSAGMALTFAVTVAVGLLASLGTATAASEDPSPVRSAVDGIEAAGAAPGDAVLTTPFTGGVLECLGYRVTMDSCTERWSQPLPEGGFNRDLFDYFDSVNRREGAAERYASRWDGELGWAVIGDEALAYTPGLDGIGRSVEGTLVGYLERSPDWERVNGEWECGDPARPPVYVYRKVGQPG